MKPIRELLPEKAAEIDQIATTVKRFGGIKSYFLRKNNKGAYIKVEQHKHHTGNYLDEETLIQRAKEYYSQFVDGELHVQAVPYQESPVEIVTPEWIREQMESLGITQKELVFALGIGKSDISIAVNGLKAISTRTKAGFYYYFKYLSSTQQNKVSKEWSTN